MIIFKFLMVLSVLVRRYRNSDNRGIICRKGHHSPAHWCDVSVYGSPKDDSHDHNNSSSDDSAVITFKILHFSSLLWFLFFSLCFILVSESYRVLSKQEGREY
jgi:hypothetical protein